MGVYHLKGSEYIPVMYIQQGTTPINIGTITLLLNNRTANMMTAPFSLLMASSWFEAILHYIYIGSANIGSNCTLIFGYIIHGILFCYSHMTGFFRFVNKPVIYLDGKNVITTCVVHTFEAGDTITK